MSSGDQVAVGTRLRNFEEDIYVAEREIWQSIGKGWDNTSFLFDPDYEEEKLEDYDLHSH